MQPLISVIVPVYNSENELKKCLESLVNQSYFNLEIITINDGSTDQSGAILKRYASKYKNIRVIEQNNEGVSSARNKGLDNAKGEYIGFVDSDDYVEPEMFQILYDTLNQKNIELAICGHYMHLEKNWTMIRSFSFIDEKMTTLQALDYLYYPNLFEGYMCNKLFMKSIIDIGDNGEPLRLDEKIHICEDLLFVTQYILNIECIGYNKLPLYHYVIRKGSALQSYGENRNTELLARKKIMDLIEPIDINIYKRLKTIYVESSLNLIRYAIRGGRKDVVMELKDDSSIYLKDYFRSKEIGLKSKIRFFLIYYFPKISDIIWQVIKKIFKVTWEKTPIIKENARGEKND